MIVAECGELRDDMSIVEFLFRLNHEVNRREKEVEAMKKQKKGG